MENNNLTPENDDLQQNAAEPTVTDGAVEDLPTPAQTESTEVPPDDVVAAGNSVPEIPMPQPPAKKSKTGLIVGIVAAVVAVVAIAAVAIVMQSPQKVVLKAIETSYTMAQKKGEAMETELPMLAKSTELATQSRETKTDIKLNDLKITDMPPLVSMLMSGSTVSGSTITSPANDTYSNSYTLNMMGQKVGTLNMFNSPTVVSVGLPEFLKNTYFLNFESMVEKGADSYLFSEFSKEELQNTADSYKSYMTSLGSVTPEVGKEMNSKLTAICAETLTGIEYGSKKADGKKLYTATIPAESVKAMMTSLMHYIYIESPVADSMKSSMMSTVEDYEKNIGELSDAVIKTLPSTPTVVTMEINKGVIVNMDILTEGVSSDAAAAPVYLNVKITDLTGTNSTIVMKLEFGAGENKAKMDMNVNFAYANKAMTAAADVKYDVGSGDNMVDMVLKYGIDGNKQTDNLSFDMKYNISSPIVGTDIKMNMNTLGDYYIKDNSVMLNMDEIIYDMLVSTNQGGNYTVELNTNFGMTMATTPFAGEVTQPQGIDMLTLTANDLSAIYDEGEAAVQNLIVMFLGKMA